MKINKLQSIMKMLVLSVGSLILNSSCGDDPRLSVNVTELSFASKGGTQTFTIKANEEAGTWNAIPSDNWIKISPSTGKNNALITVTVEENTDVKPRENGYIDVNSLAGTSRIFIKQESAVPSVLVNNTSRASLEYLSDANLSQTVSIKSNTDWTIKSSSIPDWLQVSPQNAGAGTTTVTITTKNENNSSEDRHAQIEVVADNSSAFIDVTHLGGHVKNCVVSISECVSLLDQVAFKMNFSSNVRTFYVGWLTAVDFGKMSENDIIKTAEENFQLFSIDEKDKLLYTGGVGCLTNLDPGTDNYLITIAYDMNKNIGDIKTEKVTTKRTRVQEPMAYIGDLFFDNNYWYVQIASKENNCWGYYAYLTEDPDLVEAPNAVYAWYIDKGIKDKTLEKYTGTGEDALVKQPRGLGSSGFGVGVQGYDSNNVLAGILDRAGGYIESSRSMIKVKPVNKEFKLYPISNTGKVLKFNK